MSETTYPVEYQLDYPDDWAYSETLAASDYPDDDGAGGMDDWDDDEYECCE